MDDYIDKVTNLHLQKIRKVGIKKHIANVYVGRNDLNPIGTVIPPTLNPQTEKEINAYLNIYFNKDLKALAKNAQRDEFGGGKVTYDAINLALKHDPALRLWFNYVH